MVEIIDEAEEEFEKRVRTLRDQATILRSRIDAQSTQIDGTDLKISGMRAEAKAIKQELDLYARALEVVIVQNRKLREDMHVAEERAKRAEATLAERDREIAGLLEQLRLLEKPQESSP